MGNQIDRMNKKYRKYYFYVSKYPLVTEKKKKKIEINVSGFLVQGLINKRSVLDTEHTKYLYRGITYSSLMLRVM